MFTEIKNNVEPILNNTLNASQISNASHKVNKSIPKEHNNRQNNKDRQNYNNQPQKPSPNNLKGHKKDDFSFKRRKITIIKPNFNNTNSKNTKSKIFNYYNEVGRYIDLEV